jgi:probable F420-dependent oxidoreductase
MTPRVWVSAGFLPEEDVLALAPEIERLGFDGMTFPDHVFTPVSAEGRYPYSADGRPPFRPETPWPDALVLIAAVAARTRTLGLMTAVQVLPLRHPALFAKAAGTAARISSGRLVLGIGAGWQREEFDALGVKFDRRGALVAEGIAALRALWGPQPAEHHGAAHDFGPLQMFPTPPPIEVVVGGASAAALRRAAELGDGWILPTQPLAEVPGALERLDAALDAAGRAREGFRVFVPCLGAGAEQIAAVLAPVVSDITIMPWPHPGKQDTSVDAKVACLQRWRDEVLAPLHNELAA